MSTPLEAFEAAVRALFPTLDAPRLAQYRVVREDVDRLSLQRVSARDKTPDMVPIEVWPGVPGVTSKPEPGELVIVAFVGADDYPVVLGRAAKDAPGDVPIEVNLDASRAISVFSRPESATSLMTVGPALTSVYLARAADVNALLGALVALGTTLSASLDPSVVIVGNALTAALSGIMVTPTTMLRAT